jgi:hypothetical protein
MKRTSHPIAPNEAFPMFCKLRFFSSSVLATLAVLAMTGCASTRPIPYSGIASSAQLSPNLGKNAKRMPYSYAAPVDWRRYTNLIIDPVQIYAGQDSQFEKVSDSDKTTLAQYMGDTFGEQLRQRFTMVSDPATPATLRLRLTLTGAKKTTALASTFTRFDLAGTPYNLVQSMRGGQGTFTGSVSYAVEIYDAATGHLLYAYVEKQYPNAMNIGATIGALSASKTGIRKGADELVAAFDVPAHPEELR